MSIQFSEIKKVDEQKQIAFAEVYVPGVLDSQGEYMVGEEIEKMAHEFLREGNVTAVDTEHDLKENGSYVVESFIARKGDPDFIEGAWVVAVKIPDPEIWQQVMEGNINGFSMYGRTKKVERVVEIEIPDDGIVKGVTEKSNKGDHRHDYRLLFNNDGEFVGGIAMKSDDADHEHTISKGTATEFGGSDKHNHRFSFLEALSS